MTRHTLSYSHARIEVQEHGAHLCSWQYEGKEQLFLSPLAKFEKGAAIRGGVPICFPQFATFGSGQKHGFARNLDWALSEKSDRHMRFTLQSSDASYPHWPHTFELHFDIALAEKTLEMRLHVLNSGRDAFRFGAALHSYFLLDDVRECALQGLQNQRYWDNGDDFEQRQHDPSETLGINGPLDRVYFGVNTPVQLIERGQTRHISKTGFDDIVIWNPWHEGTKKLADMGDNDYLRMLCIEAALVDRTLTLNAGESWQGSQRIRLA